MKHVNCCWARENTRERKRKHTRTHLGFEVELLSSSAHYIACFNKEGYLLASELA